MYNKALKRDLARVAFSVCVEFGGYGTVRYFVYCVPAPLNAALAIQKTSMSFGYAASSQNSSRFLISLLMRMNVFS